MYAVIETGGKQYRVEVGTELAVELLDVEPGKTVSFDRVLLVADGDEAAIGQPVVDGAAVSAEVLRQARGEKLISFKYRPKARSRVKKGHRQELTILRINDIVFGGKSAAKTAAKAESDAKTERQRLEEAAAAQAAKDAELAAKLAAGETPRRRRPRPRPRRPRRPTPRPTPAPPRPRPTAKPAAEQTTTRSRPKATATPTHRARPTARRRARRRRKSAQEPPHQEGRVDDMAHKKAGGSVKLAAFGVMLACALLLLFDRRSAHGRGCRSCSSPPGSPPGSVWAAHQRRAASLLWVLFFFGLVYVTVIALVRVLKVTRAERRGRIASP